MSRALLARRAALLLALGSSGAANATPPDAQDCLAELEPSGSPADQAMQLIRETRDGISLLRAEGRIDPGVTSRVETMLGGRVDEVWLDSPGGDRAEALRLGRALRARGVVTRVPAGATCIDACAEAFLGGIGRMVDGRIGFAALPVSDPVSPQSHAERENEAARWTEQRADYYIRAGVSRGLLRLQLDVPAGGVCYLSESGRRRYNVANAGAPGSAPAR